MTSPDPRGLRARLRIGAVWVDVLTHDDALDEITALVAEGRGGAIYTPNVDHIVMAESNAPFRRAYARASLTLADGMPLLWASRLLRPALPAKLSGSDMIVPLARLAAQHGWRVYLLGGAPGAADECARVLHADCGVHIVGTDDMHIPMDGASDDWPVVDRIRQAKPDLVFVALGAPKQELWIDSVGRAIAPAVCIGVGASLDFIAGMARRSPPWMSRVGLEWVHRLASDPRRLWRRYLVKDPAFVSIVMRTMRLPVGERVEYRVRAPVRAVVATAAGVGVSDGSGAASGVGSGPATSSGPATRSGGGAGPLDAPPRHTRRSPSPR